MKARHSGLFSRNKIKKRYRDRHKKLGLCITCSNKAKDNMVRCEDHINKQREYRERFNGKKKEQ